MDITAFHDAAALFRKHSDELAAIVADYNREASALRRTYSARVKRAFDRAMLAESALKVAIIAHPELFEDPRTHVAHGVRFGYRKGRGGISWDDDETLVERLQKNLADNWGRYVKLTYKPMKAALVTLDAATLKKLGVVTTGTKDAPVVALESGDLDKTVQSLLAEAEAERGE